MGNIKNKGIYKYPYKTLSYKAEISFGVEKIDMIGQERLSTGNLENVWDLTMQTCGICTTRKLPLYL